MPIPDEDWALLKQLGLKEADRDRFDEEFVRYESDPEKGVRVYDPYYRTGYDEYIDSDGWSAWSSEQDTFMSDILRAAHAAIEQRKGIPKASHAEITDALKKKFGQGGEQEGDGEPGDAP